jgi:hypothetical protein
MKLRHALKWLLMALAVQLAVAGTVSAETTDADDGSALTSEENLSLIDEDISALTNKQKLDRAAKKINQMRTTLGGISEMLQTVRDNERDILKINCINEKHAAIKGFVKVSEQSYGNLQTAANNADGGAADHHYTLVSVAHQKVQGLAEEARLCTGEERRFAGQSEIDVRQPTNGAEEVDVPEDDILVEDLPELTPYQ